MQRRQVPTLQLSCGRKGLYRVFKVRFLFGDDRMVLDLINIPLFVEIRSVGVSRSSIANPHLQHSH